MNHEGCNCNVMSETDHSHVSRVTPLDTKRKELKEAAMMMEPEERMQEKQNNSAREKGDARPLGGTK